MVIQTSRVRPEKIHPDNQIIIQAFEEVWVLGHDQIRARRYLGAILEIVANTVGEGPAAKRDRSRAPIIQLYILVALIADSVVVHYLVNNDIINKWFCIRPLKSSGTQISEVIGAVREPPESYLRL